MHRGYQSNGKISVQKMMCPELSDLPPPEGRIGWPWTEESSVIPSDLVDSPDWPRISIVTPSYNQGQFIEETIRSVLLQGYPDIEYIIVDGGSTDNTIEIIEKYEKWITRWVVERDYGQSHAINKGFNLATGEFGNWLNSDDILMPNALGELGALYAGGDHVNYILAGAGYEIDVESRTTRERPLIVNHIPSPLPISLPITGGIQQSLFFSLNLFREAGGLNPTICYPMDIDLQLCFGFLNPEISTTDKFIAGFRKHENSKTIGQSSAMTREKKILFDFYRRKYPESNDAVQKLVTGYLFSTDYRRLGLLQRLKVVLEIFLRTPRRLLRLSDWKRMTKIVVRGVSE